jgi:ribosomal-protein-alanine N-acetyltransferase
MGGVMRIPFVPPRQRDFVVEALSAEDLAAVAAMHREDFARPWSEEEFHSLLAQDTVFGFCAREVGHGSEGAVGFVLARLVAGEGEILSVAVARSHRRLGLGWLLMDAVLRDLHARRADALFLEVDESNTPAVTLYRHLGFLEVGRRPGYYGGANGAAASALVMRRDLH